ncbi:MAG: hypothetical protein HY654_02545 [Acidobacteria bacterium]|nr:hypothetical protein [Acidobacteriota bacterium]
MSAHLRRLPAPRAPHTLLPRVLAAVRQWRERPWYTRAWFSWPIEWQVASSLLLGVVVTGLVWLLGSGEASELVMWRASTVVVPGIANLGERLSLATTAARVAWHTVEPLVVYACAAVMLMCAACAVFGAALGRVMFERAVQR